MEKEIEDILDEACAEIVKRHDEEGQRASGRTAASIRVETLGEWHWAIKAAAYIEVLQDGRRAGKVPANFASIIAAWARAKGLTFETAAAARRFAYFTARKIAREGTQLHRSGRHIDILDTPLTTATKRIREVVELDFETEIKNRLYGNDNN